MPIPTPHDGENQDDFHGRCMSAIWDEYGKNPAQANAICFSAWREHHSKSIDTATGLVAYDLQGQRKKAMIGGPKRLYGLIEKVEEVGDGTIKVHGIASTEDEDDQGEVVRASAMREAIPDYMKFGAVREMHGLSAAGRALECNCGDDNITRIVAHVVDPVAVKKVQTKTYNGFSIGGRVLEREPGSAKHISRLALHEISLVDRPANPRSVIDLWKLGDSKMPDGFGQMEAAFNDALAKVEQTWACGTPGHRHIKKEDAAKCVIEKASRPQVGDPQVAVDTRKEFPKNDPRFNKDDMTEAAKYGLPGQEVIKPEGGTTKHGLPGQDGISPGDPPGASNSEGNFDGDGDSDDREHSAESAGDGYWPESEADRRGDFGKKKNGDGKPKGDYGDVTYADPGYRGKPRYPIDTEDHIRAAWSYINMPKNARKYNSTQLAAIKGRIKAAMKRIGAEVSEKLADNADQIEITDMVTKTLEGAEMLRDLVIEKAGRRQSAADHFLMNVAHDTIGKLTDMAYCMKAEANATQDTARNAEHPAPNEGTDSGTEHYRLGENATQDTAKRGARHSTATMNFLRKAHDAMCKAGASCPAHDDGMSKASTTEDGAMSALTTDDGVELLKAKLQKKFDKKLNKAKEDMAAQMQQQWQQWRLEQMAKGADAPPVPPPAAERPGKVKKAMGAITEQLQAMQQKIEQIANTPMPGAAIKIPAGILDVSKVQDGQQAAKQAQIEAAQEVAKRMNLNWDTMSEEDRFKLHYHMFSKTQPYVQQR